MEFPIHHHDEVWTQDEKHIGLVDRIYHRSEGVDPDVKYYDSYLRVEDLSLGLGYYVPTDYIAEVDEKNHRVTLTTTMKQVQRNTWDRTPDFVLAGKAKVVSLETAAAS